MTYRILSVLLAASLVTGFGCSSDGATASEFDEDTGQASPTDSSTDETATDTGTPTTETTPGDAPATDTMMATDTAMMGETPAKTPVKCGTFTCTAAQECCIIGGIGACVTTGAVCAGSRYSCTSKSNCGAEQVCCISGSGSGGASCAAASACPSTTTCETNAECSGSMKTCTDIGGGVKACRK